MMILRSKEEEINSKKNLSIEVCDNLTTRLHPSQKREIKLGALIAIRNFIKESRIEDPILYNFLIDTIADPDKKVKDFVLKIIKEVSNQEMYQILHEKQIELSGELRKEVTNLLKSIKNKFNSSMLLNT